MPAFFWNAYKSFPSRSFTADYVAEKSSMLMALSDSFGEDRDSALVRQSVVAGTRGEGTRLRIGVLAGYPAPNLQYAPNYNVLAVLLAAW